MKSGRDFICRSFALLLTLALIVPTGVLAVDNDGGEIITGEPASTETEAAGIPKMLDDAVATTVHYSVSYHQTDARSILDMVNEFRTGDDAWYWDENDSEKIKVSGLGNLTYDYNLEKVAMQRAAELAIYYSHTRPNGNTCWTAYSELDYGYTEAAENIAVSSYSSASQIFEKWKEEDEPYSGQGHRRNMLSVGHNFTAIGIACVECGGYYYWVQEFATPKSSINSTETTANDNTTDVSAEVEDDQVTSASLFADPSSYELLISGTASLPVISASVKLTETWPSSKSCSISSVNATWSSADSSIASVSGDTVTGVKSGETSLTAVALGESISVPVSVGSISGATVILSQDSYTYDGTEKKPTVMVQFGSSTLTKDTDYSVSYSNNINAGTATVTVTGTGNYIGSQTVNFTINKASQTLTTSLTDSSITVGNSTTITASGEGTISYNSSNTNVATVSDSGVVTGVGAGTAAITVTAAGNDNYESASKTLNVEVIKGDQTLTASPKASSIAVGETTTIVVSGQGTISYKSSDTSVATVSSSGVVTGVGTGTTTITVTAAGNDNYNSASTTISIEVTKANQTVSASAKASSIAVGSTTTITVSGKGTISYKSSNTSIATVSSSGVVTGVGTGTATITVTAAGDDNYNSASTTLSITVTKASQTVTASAKSSSIVVGKTTTITASGKGSITYSSSNTKIATVNSSGKVTAKSPGKVTITVKAAGNSSYSSASKKVTITVKPKATKLSSVKNKSSKKAVIKWKKVSGVTGYQIQYSTSKTFKSGNKSATVKGASKVSETISKLKKGKTYYFRVRTYKTVSGTKYYSAWSSAKKVKIKK